MPVMRALWSMAALVFVAACSSGGVSGELPGCRSDSECGASQICFPEGCGDPGTGIVVEVTGSNSSGIFEHDLAVADGTLTPTFDLQITGALSLVGELQRERTPGIDPTNRAPYTEPTQLVAVGASDLIPGLTRTYQAALTSTDNGVYRMPLGMGSYRVTAKPLNSSVPPMTLGGVTTGFKKTATANFAFPSIEGAVTISGRLLESRTEAPLVETPLTVPMSLQAFDPIGGDALSQLTPVSSGLGAKGDFILTMAPIARSLSSVLLVATPREGSPSVPTKTFIVPTPMPSVLTLTMGKFGTPGRVTGQVVNAEGGPIAGASVMAEGLVTGGGRFRSKMVTTDQAGGFELEALANIAVDPLLITVGPPMGRRARVTQFALDLSPSAVPRTTPYQCPDRVTVSGLLARSDGSPAPGVVVQAVAELSRSSFPMSDAHAVTDIDGAYTLALDPGSWRLEFLPGEDLPRFSRRVAVADMSTTMVLGTLTLPKARRVTGSVTNTGGATVELMPSAAIRYFRVTQSEGEPASVLLGSSIADSKGNYVITLPTR